MAQFVSTAREELIDAVRAGLNDANIKGFDIEDAERINWMTLVERYEANLSGEKLAYPWIVVHFGQMTTVEWGLRSDCYELPFTVYFIDGIKNGTSTGKTTIALRTGIEDKLNAIKNALRADTTGKFTMLDTGISIDLSVDSAMNSYFLGGNIPLFGGSLATRILIGEPM